MKKACISVSGPSLNECKEQIASNDFIELRYDLFSFDPIELNDLYKKSLKIIATCRPEKIDIKKQRDILQNAIENGVEYIDIEIESEHEIIKNLIANAKKTGTKVILSYHNFIETPNYKFLVSVVENAIHKGADIVKIACQVNEMEDNSKLLALHKDFKNIIAFGMGEKGRISRLASIFLGAPFTYVAPDKNYLTANGQFTLKEYEQLIKKLN